MGDGEPGKYLFPVINNMEHTHKILLVGGTTSYLDQLFRGKSMHWADICGHQQNTLS